MNEFRSAIDTSGAVGYTAIRLPGGEILESESDSGSGHEGLAGQIADLVRRAGADYSQIASGILGSGPGSFTGLRIGYSMMQGLAAAAGFPVVEIPSLEAFAWGIRGRAEVVGVLRDARRQEVFAQFFQNKNGEWSPLGDPRIMPIRDLDRLVEQTAGTDSVAVGWPRGEEIPPDLALSWRDRLLVVERAGTGLLTLPVRDAGAPGPIGLSGLRPTYVRVVSARTVAERRELTKTGS